MPRRVKGSSLRPFRIHHSELRWLTGQLNLALPAPSPGGYVDKHVELEQVDTRSEVIQTEERRWSGRRLLTSVDCCTRSRSRTRTTATTPFNDRLAHLVERRHAGSAARDAERVSSRAAGKSRFLRDPQTRPSTNPMRTEALASLRASLGTAPARAHCLEGGDPAPCSV
jgi:hypothetical protein